MCFWGVLLVSRGGSGRPSDLGTVEDESGSEDGEEDDGAGRKVEGLLCGGPTGTMREPNSTPMVTS